MFGLSWLSPLILAGGLWALSLGGGYIWHVVDRYKAVVAERAHCTLELMKQAEDIQQQYRRKSDDQIEKARAAYDSVGPISDLERLCNNVPECRDRYTK